MESTTSSPDVIEEDPSLLDGTYRVTLSLESQQRLDCVVGLDLHPLKTMKLIPLVAIKKDLEDFGKESDFDSMESSIHKCVLKEVLLLWQVSEEMQQEALDTTNTRWFSLKEANFLLCLNKDSKMGYIQREEDLRSSLIDRTSLFESRLEKLARPYRSRGSEKEIAAATVVASRAKIRLQVTHSQDATSRLRSVRFSDTLPSTLSLLPFNSSLKTSRVRRMHKGSQAVADLSTLSTQTTLRQPREQCVQYEPRVMSDEQRDKVAQSQSMQDFIERAERIVREVRGSPDIMGWLGESVSLFYRRNERRLVVDDRPRVRHMLFELNWTRGHRVQSLAFHPSLSHIVVMAVRERGDYEKHFLKGLSERLLRPKVVLLWSLMHPQYPQLLLRPPDDVQTLIWHPVAKEVLVAGCHNGQICVWDISKSVMGKLEKNECLYRTKNLMANLTGMQSNLVERENEMEGEMGLSSKGEFGFDVLTWTVESNAQESHTSAIRHIHFLPSTVVFSGDSAYPKLGSESESMSSMQLMTCDADNYVLVWFNSHLTISSSWTLTEKDVSSSGSGSLQPLLFSSSTPQLSSTLFGWDRLRSMRSSLNEEREQGRFGHLDRVWQPVHRIRFWDPKAKVAESELFKTLITSIYVVARPEMMSSNNVSRRSSRAVLTLQEDDKKKRNEDATSRRDSNASSSILSSSNVDASQLALPTFLMAGTIMGELFRVDMTKVKVDVETNDLICKVEWVHTTHDGPVTQICPSPFHSDLLVTAGGTIFAFWRDSHGKEPLIWHSTGSQLISRVSWSLTQAHILFMTSTSGRLEVWDVRSQLSKASESHEVSGRMLTELEVAFNPLENATQTLASSIEKGRHYVAVGDDDGNVFVMELPIHLRSEQTEKLNEVLAFMEECERRNLEEHRLRDERLLTKEVRRERESEEMAKHNLETNKERENGRHHDQLLAFYFARERKLLRRMYGQELWMHNVKHEHWPREMYAKLDEQEEEQRLSSAERKRRAELEAAKARRRLGRSIYRKYSEE